MTGVAILTFLALLLALFAWAIWYFLQLVEEKKATLQGEQITMVEETDSLLAGRQAIQEMSYDAAVKYFTRVIELNPKSIEGWTMLADVQLKQGNDQDALVSLQRRIELLPESARPHFLLARIYRSKGKNEEALQSLKEAVRIAPLDPLFSNTLYILRVQNGELEQVSSELKAMPILSQTLERTFIFGRAAVALAEGNQDASIRYILRARDYLPEDTYNTLLYEEFFAPVIDQMTAIAKIKVDVPAPAVRKDEEVVERVENVNGDGKSEEKTEPNLQSTDPSDSRPSSRPRQR